MRRSKDPLTATTTSILKPAITPLGFREISLRSFGRVNDGVLQYFNLQLSAWGSKKFAVNYAAMALFIPRQSFAWIFGGRLPRGKSSDGWWASKTHELADSSMHDVVARFIVHCVPWFERTSTTLGFLNALLKEHATRQEADAHYLFEIGCCHAYLGQIAEAQSALELAISTYHRWHKEVPGRVWCLGYIKLCEQLVVAIRVAQHIQLLTLWQTESIRNLKLQKIL